MENIINTFETGDIILFSNNYSLWDITTWSSFIVEYFSNSKYSHIGMILKDPTWLNKKLTGIYLWESVPDNTIDPQDNKKKLGVKLTPIAEIFKSKTEKLFLRKLINKQNKLNPEVLHKIHESVYDKPYDLNIIDWIDVYYKIQLNKPTIDRFFCSAFIGFIYSQSNIINKNINWDLLKPSDFAPEGKYIIWNSTFLGDLIPLN